MLPSGGIVYVFLLPPLTGRRRLFGHDLDLLEVEGRFAKGVLVEFTDQFHDRILVDAHAFRKTVMSDA